MDDYTRQCLAIEVDTSLGGVRVRRVLETVLEKRGKPEAIVVDRLGSGILKASSKEYACKKF